MNDHGVFFAQFPYQLTYRFDVGQGLYISYGSPNFGDDNIVFSTFPQQHHSVFDLVGNVWNNLYCFA